MQLIDFTEDSQLNALRQQMGTSQLGHFELFDPQKQLSYNERETLSSEGLQLMSHEVRVLKDKTLAFKNSRIWLLQHNYHLANCPSVQQLRLHSRETLIGTYQWPTSKHQQVCLECLAVLQYQGIDARRLRRLEFSEQISEQFSLAEFQQCYPFYPLLA